MPTADGREPRSAAVLAILASLALLACGSGPPDGVERAPLHAGAAPVALAEHAVGSETRPALPIGSGAPATLTAPARGRLHLAVAPGEGATFRTVLRVSRAGATVVEATVGTAPRWTSVTAGTVLHPGNEIVLEATGGGTLWVADPHVVAPRSRPATPLVVVILVDTIRADHTTLGGYGLATSPTLEALAADGVAFLRAYAPSPWTRPSAASLLTGLSPPYHRVNARDHRLPASVETWAEIARAEGFATVAVVTNPNVLAQWGFAQGFARFIDLGAAAWGGDKTEATAVYDAALRLLDEERPPLFLFLHVLDPHHPYQPPVEVARRLYPDYRDVEPGREVPEDASETLLRSAVRRYDGEIRDADEALGRFLDGLRARGLYEDAAIVVTGDHGEEFHDHGGRYHGHTLYEEQLRIPLVMKLPGASVKARTVESLVALEDALPTVADAIGWPLPAGLQGRSLLPAIRGDGAVRTEVAASTRLDGAHAYALVTGEHKLIQQVAPRRRTLLFDLASDPGEQMPLYDPETSRELAARLDRRFAEAQAGWHLRACGGAEASTLGLEVDGLLGEAGFVGFEEDDRATAGEGRIVLSLSLAPRPVLGAPEGDRPRPDRDEVVFDGDRIRLRLDPPAELPLRLGDAPRPWSDPTSLDPDDAARSPLDPPACPEEAALLAWFVEESAAERFEPDAALLRRLEDLGYVADPAPPDAP